MKNKFVLINVLLVLALSSTACAAQEATRTSGGVTARPTSAPNSTPDSSAPTEEGGEAMMTPTTGSGENVTPTQGMEGTAVIPQTGPGEAGLPDDLDEVMRVLIETGATLDLGDAVQQDYLTVPGQILMINGEEVQIYTYNSAEEVELQSSQIPANEDPEEQPHFYRLGSMLVRYAGTDTAVRDLLEDVLGARAVGQ
jgi:hypothetical protein